MRPFGPEHLIALAWTLPLVVGSCWLGRTWLTRASDGRDPHGARKERLLCVWWGAGVIGINIASAVYWFMPERFDLRMSLPLHLCDLACAMSPLVFLTRWRLARDLVYFWGMGLSTQAFVTPVSLDEPPTFRFRYWLFWPVHLAIVATAVYDLVREAVQAHVARAPVGTWRQHHLGGADGVAQHRHGWNYGYVGNTRPEQPTLIDRLGPWPLRLVWMILLAEGAFLIMTAVWWRPGKRAGAMSPGEVAT